MDLEDSDDQRMLRAATRDFVARACPTGRVREIVARPDGFDSRLWADVAAMGLPALVIPEQHDGLGRGLLDLAIVADEMGRGLLPTPLLPSVTLVALPLLWGEGDGPRERWLPALAAGDAIGAAAIVEPGQREEWDAPAMRARRTGSGWTVSGRKLLVADAAVAQVLLVSLLLDGGEPALVALDRRSRGQRLRLRRESTITAAARYEIRLDEVEFTRDELVATGEAATAVLHRALDHAGVVSLAHATGSAERALELSLEHARTRQQFGKPIGAFQAVAHRCVDMRSDIDACRYLAYQAAWALDTATDAELHVSAASSFGNDALRRVFLNAHQVHGAIGFSLEHDLQLFTRSAKTAELSLGSTARHRERLARAMGL